MYSKPKKIRKITLYVCKLFTDQHLLSQTTDKSEIEFKKCFMILRRKLAIRHIMLFVAVFLGYNQYWPGGLMVLWFYVQELPKVQPAVVQVLKRLRRRGNGLKSHPTDWEKPGFEPATPVLQDIGYPLHHSGFLLDRL